MTPRLAQRRDVNNGMYLVAKSCPHAIPEGAKFYACAMGFQVGKSVAAVTCEFARKDEIVPVDAENDNGDRLVICRHGDVAEPPAVQFGTPTVMHAESDGGDLD